MRKILVFLSLIASVTAISQTSGMSVTAKVEKDRVRLKWFPADFEQLRQLVQRGAIVDRVELPAMQDLTTIDFTNALQIVIAPAAGRLQSLTPENAGRKKSEALLEPFLSAEKPVEKEAANFAFALVTLENAVSVSFGSILGSEWTDIGIAKGKIYGYRIRIEGTPEARIVVKTAQPTQYPQIDNFAVLLDQKKAVELRWKAEKYKEYGYGFRLEKAIDAPKEGKPLTETPYVPVRTADEKKNKEDFFRDTKLQEGHTHYYRLVGLNYFGEPAFFSEWQKIYVPNHIHAEIFIDSIFAQDKKRVIVGGATSTENRPKNIAGYSLLRSDKKDAGFQVQETRKSADSTFRFEVPMPKTGDRYYYKVAAFSKDNDSSYSLPDYFFTLDQEPPGAPETLSGRVDSLGMVHLSWVAPSDTDLQGYRIYRANAKKEDFVERNVSLSLATSFTDTVSLNNLTSEVYYCVKAVDLNYNNSGFSDTLLLLKPDTIAPVAGLLAAPKISDTAIVLSWFNSPSTDIHRNYLLREANGAVDTLFRWNTSDSMYRDEQIEPGTTYSYFIRSVDKAGNNAACDQRTVFYETGFRKPVSVVNAKIDQQQKAIEITWQAPRDVVFSYQVYRSKNDGTPQLLKTIEDASATSYTDKQVNSGNTYTYYVKYILTSGIHSLPSERVKVDY